MSNARVVNTPAQAYPLDGVVHKQVTVSDSANYLSTLGSFSWDAGASHVMFQVTANSVRVTFDDSTAPTTSLGFLYDAAGVSTSGYLPIRMAKKAKFIRATGTDATVEVQQLNFI